MNENDKVTQADLEELKKKYGKVYAIDVELEDEDENPVKKQFVFKKPLSTHFDRFLKEMSGKPSVAMKNFLFGLVADEYRVELERTLEEYPGAVAGITEKLNDKLGTNASVTIKKL